VCSHQTRSLCSKCTKHRAPLCRDILHSSSPLVDWRGHSEVAERGGKWKEGRGKKKRDGRDARKHPQNIFLITVGR